MKLVAAGKSQTDAWNQELDIFVAAGRATVERYVHDVLYLRA